MSRAEEVVAAARRWIGTPYVHQMSVREAGCDCLGLIRGVWRDVIGQEPIEVPAYSMDWGEPGREERLWQAAADLMIERTHDAHNPGQVVLFRMRDGAVAKHLGISVIGRSGPAFVHAYSGHGVVESALSAPWARRVVARFDFPGE